MKLINVGFGNAVNADRVIAVVSTDSAPSLSELSLKQKKIIC